MEEAIIQRSSKRSSEDMEIARISNIIEAGHYLGFEWEKS